MTPAPIPPSRRLARALPTAFSLLALPALAVAQTTSDPLNLGYESATESHRGFDDKELPADSAAALEGYAPYEPSGAPNWVGANDTVGEIGGWRTYARETFASNHEASDGAGTEPSAMEPEMAVAAPPASGTGAKPAGSRPMPVEPKAGDRAAANHATPAAEDALRRARALSLVHDSVLDDYAAYEESDGPNWIEANRTVGEIGGWRTYARELFESSDEEGEAR